jgi:hypothetical protein
LAHAVSAKREELGALRADGWTSTHESLRGPGVASGRSDPWRRLHATPQIRGARIASSNVTHRRPRAAWQEACADSEARTQSPGRGSKCVLVTSPPATRSVT